MLKNLLGGAASAVEGFEKSRNNALAPGNTSGLQASSSSSIKRKSVADEENIESPETIVKTGNDAVDEDELAGSLFVQFPTYGTQSQALSHHSSAQWQEKTADWLLGGTSSIPTPKQQLQQRQMQQQQQMSGNSNIGTLPTVDEHGNPNMVGMDSNSSQQQQLRHGRHLRNNCTIPPKLVNSREWSVDEQLLWKSQKFSGRNVTTIDVGTNEELANWNTNGDGLGLSTSRKDYDFVFRKPLLEDPSRDFLAAYYYHVGVMPKSIDQLEDETRELCLMDETYQNQNSACQKVKTTKAKKEELKSLVQQHSSPYHLNNEIRRNISSFEDIITSLPNLSEEKEGDNENHDILSTSPNNDAPNGELALHENKKPNAVVTTTSIAEVAWMPDRLCKACYSCETPFTVFRRRHHCRICGQVFCNTCSGYFVPASSTSSSSARKRLQMIPTSPRRLGSGTTNQNPNASTPNHKSNTSLPSQTSPFKVYSGMKEHENAIGTENHSKVTLRSCKMCFDQVTAQQEQQKKKQNAAEEDRKRQQVNQQGNSGNDSGIETIVTVVTSTSQKPRHGHVESRELSITGIAESSRSVGPSTPQGLRKPEVETEDSSVLRQWSRIIGAEGISSHSKADLTPRDFNGSGIGSGHSNRLRTSSRSTSPTSSSLMKPDRSDAVKDGNRHLGKIAASHLEQMAESLLESDAPLLWETISKKEAKALSDLGEISCDQAIQQVRSKWVNKLMSLATRCCATIDTNVKRGDLLDVRPYVKIKVIPGGSCDDCAYISGVLFRKIGTNKQMAREMINPKIMLLSGGIEFTRTARIASLDTLLEQEEKYIEILVGKILKLEPDILMVGKGVSRRAQDLLLKNNVQLLQQVKSSLLNRISRQTGATIISSTDHIMNQFGAHVLGKCHRFRFIVARDNEFWLNGDSVVTKNGQHHIETLLENKTLPNHERQAALAANMLGENILDGSIAIRSGLAKRGVSQTYALIEGCPKQLGCTIVLRGANKRALKQIKNVFRFLVGTANNMKLEMSYLKERCARLSPEYSVEKRNLFSSSFCVDYGSPPSNRKVRPWNGGSNNEGIQRSLSGRITAFDHQSILITSVWMTEKTQCCPAEVKGICYYSVQDVSLGQFLRDSCFNLSLKCQNPSCKKSVLDHSLSFVHNDGLINITVDHLDEALPPAPSESERNDVAKYNDDDSDELDDAAIATWTYCNNCEKVVTPLTWLSDNTWKFSFGKFLESFFYNRDTVMNSPQSTCTCNLQKSTTLYFGCGNLAAKFTYEQIRPFGVFVRKSLPIDTSFHRARALQHLEKISKASSSLFVKFDKHIEKVAREARSVKRVSDNHHLQTVINELNRISNEVDHAAKTLQEKIASVSEKCSNEKEGIVDDAALFRFPWHARRFLFMLTSAWNEKLSAAGQAIVAMKKLSSTSQRSDGGMGSNVPVIVAGDQNTDELNEGMRRLRQLHEVYSRYNLTDIYTVLPTIPGNAGERVIETEFDDDFEDPDGAIDFAAEVDADVLASRRRLYSTNVPAHTNDSSRLGVRTLSRLGDLDRTTNSQIKQTPGATVKSAITRFFQRGGRERDPYVVSLGLFHDGRPRLEPGVNGIVVPVIDEQLSTVIAYSLSSKEYDNQFQNYAKMDSTNLDVLSGIGTSPNAPPSKPQQIDATDRNSPKDVEQNRVKGQPGSSAPSSSVKKGIERRMLVRNKSHIKHTFRDLDEKGQNLCKFVCTTYWATQFHAVREAFLSQGGGSKDSIGESVPGVPSALDVEQSYILSLSSAYSWAASGGKSGASFARTADDRFVIKCISRTELQMFLDCAPAYFEYLSKAFFHGLPTVLCKIVGVYQIGYHNRVTGKRSMEQVAVMQNIFYNKKITKTFDLKGSLRGRFAAQMKTNHDDDQTNHTKGNSTGYHASETSNGQRIHNHESTNDVAGGTGEDNSYDVDREEGIENKNAKKHGSKTPRTLLDGDFLETTFGRPMPMHDRAKEVFHMSILNDTLFLSIINVLDYSILVGIDEEKMELVVGIIDFMRQYDILKQMERVGKSLPMVVGSEAPTIIQPPLYKARFTNAMERYFMTVPSKWTTI